LQSSDHFFYMSTKNMADGASHAAFSPYDSPFSAFTNYMNVLADFLVRVQEQFPESIDNEELNSLLLTISNQASEINELNKEVKTLRNNILNADDSTHAPKEELIEIAEKADVESPAEAAKDEAPAETPEAPKAEEAPAEPAKEEAPAKTKAPKAKAAKAEAPKAEEAPADIPAPKKRGRKPAAEKAKPGRKPKK
ncbi:MAG: hypothetical protein K2L34_09350, partial [Muribaculaceae bacterium]|nr:hypothetical protein [Muribaculaceae bacterium]